MTTYEHDDRVRTDGDWIVVHGDPYDRKILWMPPLGWCIYEGPGMVLLGSGNATADDAIRSLIGDPR